MITINTEPIVSELSDALRNLVAAIYLDLSGRTYEGQYENEVQSLAHALANVAVRYALPKH